MSTHSRCGFVRALGHLTDPRRLVYSVGWEMLGEAIDSELPSVTSAVALSLSILRLSQVAQ